MTTMAFQLLYFLFIQVVGNSGRTAQAWSAHYYDAAARARVTLPQSFMATTDVDTSVANRAGEAPNLLLFNSKSRTKEAFRSINDKKVSMYTCGPTVYDFAHVGNFRAFLTYDLIKRVFLYFGYDVTHICNLTDVDDKIINRANKEGIKVITDLTRKYEEFFFDDLRALNVMLADKYPRATEHIQEMMDMILGLEEKGLAYETEDGSWYFATDKKEGYGSQLVDLNWEEMETSERGEGELKRSPQDFCLWKAFKPGLDREDSSWESPPIKKGRPGWHLECSAMARKYLGDTIDIHGGGVDLKFPHHENEIAQSEGFSGKTFCNCWLHNGFVNINDEKMSKSLGNFMTLRSACPESQQVRAYRYLVVSSHYRNPLSFTPEVMAAAQKTVTRIDKVMSQINESLEGQEIREDESQSQLANEAIPKALQNFEAAITDDLSMPRAAASLFSIIKAAETEFKTKAKDSSHTLDLPGLKAAQNALLQMDRIFGIFYDVPLTKEDQHEIQAKESNAIPPEVLELVSKRAVAKESKDWELADSFRARISELGFEVKDVKGGDPEISRKG
mmetsp:Transcript_125869/g.352439  ORF Transcript_125869/g.352439 Transcript_125869/m.352439 type:complete len:561 (+) Transcript_125869:205-1887(+)